MLLALVVMVALVLIALAAAAPVVARDLRRDKEVESMHRSQQYVRALRLYYRKTKTYPPSMEALEKSNNIRYLRKQYVDPLTGKADWRIIHVGENQTTVKGFFGEPLGGLDTKGIGGGATGLGSAAGLSSGIGSTPPGAASGTTTVGQTSGLAAGFAGGTVATPSSPGGAAGAGTPGTPGTAAAAAGGLAAAPNTTTSGLGRGGVGQIMGVGSARSGESILTPNGQGSYDTWEFLYDPRIELLYQKANILGGVSSGPANSKSASDFGTDINGKPNAPVKSEPVKTPQP